MSLPCGCKLVYPMPCVKPGASFHPFIILLPSGDGRAVDSSIAGRGQGGGLGPASGRGQRRGHRAVDQGCRTLQPGTMAAATLMLTSSIHSGSTTGFMPRLLGILPGSGGCRRKWRRIPVNTYCSAAALQRRCVTCFIACNPSSTCLHVIAQVRRCLRLGNARLATKLKTEFKMSDRSFAWLRVQTLAEAKDWEVGTVSVVYVPHMYCLGVGPTGQGQKGVQHSDRGPGAVRQGARGPHTCSVEVCVPCVCCVCVCRAPG